jgi:hypothetical protein
MKTSLIIHFNLSRRPLTRLRDVVLLSVCWLMWIVVLLAVFNSTEWDLLEQASQAWWSAQQTLVGALGDPLLLSGSFWDAAERNVVAWWVAEQHFGSALLDSVHLSSSYFGFVGTLVLGFLLWSLLNLAMSSRRFGVDSTPLTLTALARHFELDAALVADMQIQKTIVVRHCSSGSVIALEANRPVGWIEIDQFPMAA